MQWFVNKLVSCTTLITLQCHKLFCDVIGFTEVIDRCKQTKLNVKCPRFICSTKSRTVEEAWTVNKK